MLTTIKREKGDVVTYQFKSEYRGLVKVKATVIDTYIGLYHGNASEEMSIRYEDLGDIITEHGIMVDSSKIIDD